MPVVGHSDLRPKLPEFRAELSETPCPNSLRADTTCIRAGSSLTTHFDPRWTAVVDARVAACVLRFGGIYIVSTVGNNVGTSSSFKEI